MTEIIARLDALNVIVQDLLVFARPRELHAEPVDLKSLLDEIVTRFRRDPAMSGIEIASDTTAAVVRADAEQLQIVFQNILLNAAQAMNGMGAIAHRRLAAGRRVGGGDRGPRARHAARRPRAGVQAFFTTKHRGTGLGLPIAKRIVDAHRGTIAIDDARRGRHGGARSRCRPRTEGVPRLTPEPKNHRINHPGAGTRACRARRTGASAGSNRAPALPPTHRPVP